MVKKKAKNLIMIKQNHQMFMFSLFIHTKRIETLRTCVTNKQKLCTKIHA